MNIEVLISAMYQKNLDIIKQCHIESDVLIINQCDEENYKEKVTTFGTVRMISTKERGLSKSRNMALENAKGDICLLCDDDVIYVNDYVRIVTKAFQCIPNADVIVFNINRHNANVRSQEKIFGSIKRIPFYKTYGSVHIAFKKTSITENRLRFNELFGTGSGLYDMAEDSLFFRDIHRKKLKAYLYPAILADVSFEESSWFHGYNQKYFYDVGAFLSAAYPRSKHIMKWYYPYRCRDISYLSSKDIIHNINQGIKGYHGRLNYNSYFGIER